MRLMIPSMIFDDAMKGYGDIDIYDDIYEDCYPNFTGLTRIMQ